MNRLPNSTLRPVSGFTMYAVAWAGRHVHRHLLRVRLDLLERAGERLTGAEQLRARVVGLVLARPADRHLDHERRDGREDREQQRAEHVAALVVAATAAEDRAAHRHPRDEGDRHRHRRRDRSDEDVAVLHVAHLVGEHAPDLVGARGPASGPGSRRPPRAPGCGRSRRRWAARPATGTRAASARRRAGRGRGRSAYSSGASLLARPASRRRRPTASLSLNQYEPPTITRPRRAR